MLRILLAGDTHGNIFQFEYLVKIANSLDIKDIWQLGDFGYFPRFHDGPEFLDQVSELMVDNDMNLMWLDGNHEDHQLLRQEQNVDWFNTRNIRPNIHYSPRGNIFELEGKKICTFGGAFSVDRNTRKVGRSFFFEEEIEQDQVDVLSNEKVDILLCHDAPISVDLHSVFFTRGRRLMPIRDAQKNRRMLQQVCEKIQPSQIYHGHYHIAYQRIEDFRYGPVRVQGLHCDGSGSKSWHVLEL